MLMAIATTERFRDHTRDHSYDFWNTGESFRKPFLIKTVEKVTKYRGMEVFCKVDVVM